MRTPLPTRDDVVRITQEIWGSMLGLELAPAAAGCEEEVGVVGCVHIVGAWDGAVRLDLSPALATKAAAAFTGVQPAEVSPDEIRDAAGELANITAGSIKALLPAPSYLSIPVAANGTDYKVRFNSGRALSQTAFSYSGERLLVTIIERAGSSMVLESAAAKSTRVQ